MASSSSFHYNYFKEKRVLQEEEKALKLMLNKFQDQLNRLKIEELALISQIKMEAELKKENTEDMQAGVEHAPVRSLDTVSEIGSSHSSMIPVGLMVEDPSKMNREIIDLTVDAMQIKTDNRMDDFEEEEEDDEEDDQNEDAAMDYTRMLRSYMDDV